MFPIRRRPLRLALLAGLLAPAAPVVAAAAPGGAPCDIVAFSPAFAADGTALCGHQAIDAKGTQQPVEIWVTTDAGRSWRRQAAAGLPRNYVQDRRGPSLVDVDFSPQYAHDHLVHVALSGNGIFTSNDLGATFQDLAPLVDMRRPPITDVMTPVGLGFLYSDLRTTQYVAPPASAPIAGAEGANLEFLVPPDWPLGPVLVLHALDGEGSDLAYRLSECDPTFTCTTTLHAFGVREAPIRIWYGADHSTLYLYLVTLNPKHDGYSFAIQRSTDGGRTFKRWAAADKLLEPLRRTPGYPMIPVVSLVVDQASPAAMHLRVSYGLSRATDIGRMVGHSLTPPSPPFPPGEQMFRTTDGGAHWTRTATGLALQQAGRPGSLPWTGAAGYGLSHAALWSPGGGKLFTVAIRDGRSRTEYSGIWCSVDGGKKWAHNCSR